MRRTITALAAVAVFVAPASAFAECAWVLWSRGSADGRLSASDWTKGGSGSEVYPTYSDCRARITRVTGSWKKALRSP
jgi:hypothetical protein